MTIELAGEQVELLSDRALWRPASRSLVITDTHWGMAATPRHAPMGFPPGSTHDDLDRLTALVESKRPERLLCLGDLIHARPGPHPASVYAVACWRSRFCELAITLVRGNHEHRGGDPPEEWRIDCFDEPLRDGPFSLRHVPGGESSAYTLAGHLHPKVRLPGPDGETRRLPCFRIGLESAILPAFNVLAGGGGFQPRTNERVFAICDQAVCEL